MSPRLKRLGLWISFTLFNGENNVYESCAHIIHVRSFQEWEKGNTVHLQQLVEMVLCFMLKALIMKFNKSKQVEWIARGKKKKGFRFYYKNNKN